MNEAVQSLIEAQKLAMKVRPKIGGFPYLAEVLYQAGVIEYEVDFAGRKVTCYGTNA